MYNTGLNATDMSWFQKQEPVPKTFCQQQYFWEYVKDLIKCQLNGLWNIIYKI